MFPQTTESAEKFSFKNPRLYRNINDNQYVLAVVIKPREATQVKKLIYLKHRVSFDCVLAGDYVLLHNGRLSFSYKDAFIGNHVLIK